MLTITIKTKTILKYLPLFLYHVVFLLILLANFPWGKFFIGWDALNPEFNLSLNLERSFFASWQENYGTGTITGHGFAAQLPHTMIISTLSLFLPLWAIRSVFTFLCLYFGGLGIYFLARLLFYKITLEEYQKKFLIAIEYICLLIALFYILNLATVQTFYLQLEAFIVHFAALPWLFWIILRLAQNSNRKNFILFFIINFVASIQGFIPSLFVVYGATLSLSALVYILVNKFSLISVKKSLLVLLLTFIINSYWLLPFSYYLLSKGGQTQNAYNNLISTEDFILKNKKYGNLQNVSLMKGFSFDMQELGGYVFQPWIEHYDKNEIKIVGYGLFFFTLVSAMLSLILIRHVLIKISAAVLLYFLASLATDSPLFSYFTQIIQAVSPSYYQAFRTTFTKFSLGYSFLFTLFFGLGLYMLLVYFYRFSKHKIINLSVFTGLFFLLIYYALPVFTGNLLYKKLQLDVPQAYFEVMDFFKNKENGRIADFPVDCPEGWYGYKWGYFGSGFYWYGIKQPILSRAFDVWNPSNENYYWEIVYALRSQDYEKVGKILQKYDVRWLVYDPSLIHCRTAKGFNFDNFIKYIEESSKYKLVKTASNGVISPIKIYEKQERTNAFIKIGSDLQNIGPSYNWTSDDKAFLEYGDYLTNENKSFDVYFPFRSFLSTRSLDDLEFNVVDKGEYFSFQATISDKSIGTQLIIPPITHDEAIEIDPNDLSLSRELLPQIFIDGKFVNIDIKQGGTIDISYIHQGNLEVRVPKIRGYYSYDSKKSGDILKAIPKSCDEKGKDTHSYEFTGETSKKLLRLTNTDSSNCLDVELSNLSQREAYLVFIENRNIEGKSLLLTSINKTSQKPEVEIYLPNNKELKSSFLIIPPMQPYAVGYTLRFKNISIGRSETVNDLGRITVNPIPYRFLTSLKITKGQHDLNQQVKTTTDGLIIDHPNPTYYRVGLNNEIIEQLNSPVLILSQSFDNGWKAYEIQNSNNVILNSPALSLPNGFQNLFPFMFGKELKEHVLVNNWTNGWVLDNYTLNANNYTLVVVFLPQYLEYFGFLIMGAALLLLATSSLLISKFMKN